MSKLDADQSETLHQRKPSKRQAGNEDMLRNGPREATKLQYSDDEKAEMGKLVFQEVDDLKQAKGPAEREGEAESLGNMNPKDKRAVILLVILCASLPGRTRVLLNSAYRSPSRHSSRTRIRLNTLLATRQVILQSNRLVQLSVLSLFVEIALVAYCGFLL